MISNIKFRKILNDLKRQPEDAAKELKISVKKINKFLSGKSIIDFDIIKKAVEIWPVNYGDFFSFKDDTSSDYKIMRSKESIKSERVMKRGGKSYYSYKDTIMSKLSPFKPELIKELVVVKNNKPSNKLVKFNNGHFLHQFTYFIGPVNFYYIRNGRKFVSKMNTGDSMYISPYVPHSFTTRKNNKNELGKILALTYSDLIDNETLNELSALGFNVVKKYKLNLKNKNNSFWSNLNHILKVSSISLNEFCRNSKINLNKLKKNRYLPSFSVLNKISNFLNVNLRDLLPPYNFIEVKIQKYSNNRKWFYPSFKKKKYLFNELVNLSQLPYSRGFEISILDNKKSKPDLEVPSHQYFYNLGNSQIKFIIEKKSGFLNPGDTMYLKPNRKHSFYKKGKLLSMRIGGRISGDILFQLSNLSTKNIKKTLNDENPWFYK